MALAQDPGRQLHELKAGQTVNAWAYEHEVAQAKGIIEAAAKVEGLKAVRLVKSDGGEGD
jgi:hypothetical protein